MFAATPSLRGALFLQISIHLLLVLQTNAYVLSQSCYNYGTPPRDISNGIHASMAEAQQMAGMGSMLITSPVLVGDDLRGRLWVGANPQVLAKIKGDSEEVKLIRPRTVRRHGSVNPVEPRTGRGLDQNLLRRDEPSVSGR
jgi:hypothetical protein